MMKNTRAWLFGLAFCLTLCCCACGRGAQVQQTTEAETVATVTAAATTASESSAASDATTAPVRTAEDYPEIGESHEEWLRVGLEYYLTDREVTLDVAAYFEQEGVGALTLYNDWFTYDPDHAEPIAALFFRYMMDNHGYEALFDRDRRVAYKDAFLKSLSPSLTYGNDPDTERLLSQMVCDANANYRYIIRLDGATYCFRDFEYSISLIHRLLYNNAVAVARLKAYIEEIEGYEQYFDLSQSLRYNMTLAGGASSTKHSTKVMTINTTYAMLHETVHAWSLYEAGQNRWLSEGMAEHLGKTLGLDSMVNETHFLSLYYVEQGWYDAQIAAGNADAIRYGELYRRYTEQGGQTASVEAMDCRLYTDAYAAAEFAVPYEETLASVYEALNGKAYAGDGGELTYKQAASLVSYLIDRFGIETVLTVLSQPARLEELLGAPYATLYAQWRESIGA